MIEIPTIATLILADAEQARGLLRDSAVSTARAAASALDGVVIQSDDEAALVGDNLKAAKDGAKLLKDLEAILLHPLKARIEAIRDELAPIHGELSRATKGGNDAILAWDAAKQRKAREERARLEELERENAAKAQAEADATGEDAPPPMDIVAPPPAKIVRGGQSTTFIQRRLAVALADVAKCDPSWLGLVGTLAKASAEAAEKRGELVIPDTATEREPVIWKGLRVWRSSTVASRG